MKITITNIRLARVSIALILLISTHLLFAEGTLQLRPSEDQKGSLYIAKHEKFTAFGQYNAPEENQMKLNIKEVGETVYFGLNNKDSDGDFIEDVPFRIVAPSGAVAYNSEIPDDGEEGNIDDWDEAEAGPAELGNAGGYDAIEFTPTEVGDYVIEFDPFSVEGDGIEMFIHLFDFTVLGTDGLVKVGRLHSKGWQLTSEGGGEELSSTVYPYGLNGVVYKVDFQEMRPYTFVINFNSKGVQDTGDFVEDRKSVENRNYFPEFEVFLNEPDESVYPTNIKSVNLESIVENTDCETTTFCLNFSSDDEGLLEGYVDVNQNGIMDTLNGDVYFNHYFDKADTICIPWDGKDNAGNLITDAELEVISSFGYGVMHLPLVDVEENPNGYKVDLIRPTGLGAPQLFWDDSELTDGTPTTGGLTELEGCDATTTGCHGWTGRGNGGSEETINTWWYSNLISDKIKFDPRPKSPIQLSYDANTLQQYDTTLCKGDQLTLHIFNDGVSHYNNTMYDYSWFVGDEYQSSTNQSFSITADSNIQVIVKAFEHEFSCEYYDTIEVSIQEQFKIDTTLTHPNCIDGGVIEVEVVEGPSNPVFNWVGITQTSDSVFGLNPGTYDLTITDPAFSNNCALNASFTLDDVDSLALDNVTATSSLCYDSTGTAEVFYSGSEVVNYSWNGAAFSASTTVSDLYGGTNYVIGQKVNNGCKDSIAFLVDELPLEVDFAITDADCDSTGGEIQVHLPQIEEYFINWNSNTGTDTLLSGLKPGDYLIEIEHQDNPTCSVDSTVKVGVPASFKLDEVLVDSSLCYEPTAEAQVIYSGTESLEYSWDGNALTTNDTQTGLNGGNHKVVAVNPSNLCKDSIEFTVIELPLEADYTVQGANCDGTDGEIQVLLPAGESFTITWNGTIGGNQKTGLTTGDYAIQIISDDNASCVADSIVEVPVDPNTLEVIGLDLTPSNCINPNGAAELHVKRDPSKAYTYSWNGGTAILDDSINTNLSVGTHAVSVYESGGFCGVDTTFEITGNGFSFNYDSTNTLCGAANGSISVVQTTSSAFIQWADGSTDFSRDDLKSGSYTFTISLPGVLGCSETKTVTLNDSSYVFDFTSSVVPNTEGEFIAAGDEVIFDTDKNSAQNYSWDFGDGNTSTEVNPTHTYQYPGEYEYSLQITDQQGCVNTVYNTVTVNEQPPCTAAIPKAFSPNGDGINDALQVLGDYHAIDLQIYNRWGELVFRSYAQHEKWDGYYRGEQASMGVFPYVLEVECENYDGSISSFKKIGDVTLVR